MNQAVVNTMSPQEYLEYLQEQELGGRIPGLTLDVADVLTAGLISALPDDQREHLEKMKIAIGVLPAKQINAWAISVPSGGEVIAFSFSTLSFLLALNKVLMSRVNILGLEPTMGIEAAAKLARSIAKAFETTAKVPRMQVHPRRMLIASALSNVQVAFAVGHELSHHILGHFQHMKGKNLKEKRPSKLQAMEFEADRRGAELAFASYMRTSDALFGAGDTTLAQAGADIFFTYLNFMWDVSNVKDVDAEYQTHPTPELRRTKLREHYWEDMPEQARALAQQAEAIFGAFAAILEPKEESVTTEHSMDRAASSRPRRPRKK